MLAAQLDDESAEDVGVDRWLEDDFAAGAGAQLGFQSSDLVVIERPGGDDFGDRLAAVLGGDPPERADDLREARACGRSSPARRRIWW